ncbi:MAG: hypothetical protein OEW18_07910 [Candidatus Aminicenantes bacterium]|nr:hypothetical protein [Candidatus Aminicenantes bacterium]
MKPWLRLVTVIAVLSLGFSPSCSSPGAKMYVVVNFDVEDYISPESEHIDDIPKWLAEIMTEEGATGTFFVIGEKARSFEKRGRFDVITAMARHDVESHTNFGSIHPTVTEILEKAGWENGVRQMFDQESAGFRELERIFGTPIVTLARHGGSYGPQLICALGKMKAGYAGSPVSLPGRSVVWFCNALNFYGQYDGYDDTYYRDDLFEPLLQKLQEELPKLAGTTEVLPFFAGHPCKIRTEQFWDLNFYEGRNPGPEEWKTPEMRPLGSMVTAQKNFRRLMRYLKSRDDIELTTFRKLMDLYSYQKERLSQKDLSEMAADSLRDRKLSSSEDFSPAEAFAGLARSIVHFQANGTLPHEMDPIRPLGPSEMPLSQPEISRVTLEDVYDLAVRADAHISQSGALPACLDVEGRRIGTGSLFALFSTVYLNMGSGNSASEYEVVSFDPYPKTSEEEIIQRVREFKTWPVHRPDLDMEPLIEMTRMQLWTLKPAHKK